MLIMYPLYIVLGLSSAICRVQSFHHELVKYPRSLRVLAVNNLGSDSLIRPEDENSPEFREYLNKILQLQANRAKTGFSAPSSGSSEAYFTKLDRIKMEKLARRKAGLSPDDTPTSYRPEDYLLASGDLIEPVIIPDIAKDMGSPQGDAGSNKARSLTSEEMKLAKLVEDLVNKELETKQVPTLTRSATESTACQDTAPNFIPTKPTIPTKRGRTSVGESSQSYQHILETKREKTENDPKRKKLSPNEMQLVGKAMQLLAKHRGGGSFGAGRLEKEDSQQLQLVLHQVVQLFTEETKQGDQEILTSALSVTKEENSECDFLSSVSAKSCSGLVSETLPLGRQNSIIQGTVTSNHKSSDALHMAALKDSKEIDDEDSNIYVPIAVGIDQYLADPSSKSLQELHALRDAMIQLLSTLQNDISTTEQKAVQRKQSSNFQVTQRMSKEYFSSSDSFDDSSNYDHQFAKDLKLVLSLLLKHRGGVGMGKGRLSGEELAMLEQLLTSVSSKMIHEISK